MSSGCCRAFLLFEETEVGAGPEEPGREPRLREEMVVAGVSRFDLLRLAGVLTEETPSSLPEPEDSSA